MWIESSSSNWIWNPNSIVEFGLIRNPATKWSRRGQFRYKIDIFQSEFDLFLLKAWYKDWKGQLKDRKGRLKHQKSQLKDQKGQFLSKKLNYIEKVNQIQPFLFKIELFSIKIDPLSIKMAQIRIGLSWRLNRTAEIGFENVNLITISNVIWLKVDCIALAYTGGYVTKLLTMREKCEKEGTVCDTWVTRFAKKGFFILFNHADFWSKFLKYWIKT